MLDRLLPANAFAGAVGLPKQPAQVKDEKPFGWHCWPRAQLSSTLVPIG
jgi:hypothetical protein